MKDSPKIGDTVSGTHSHGFGFEGVIVEEREPLRKPTARLKVRLPKGDEMWVFDFEIDEVQERNE